MRNIISRLSYISFFFIISSCQFKEEKQPNNSNVPKIINIPETSVWSSDCKSEKYISIKTNINNVQFTIPNRFSMNSQLKKVGVNKYELYFTDFPPLIPLPDEMQIWDNLENKKPVAYFEMIDNSKMNLTWFGFYLKKTKKYIQTENPFSKENSNIASLIKCSE
ncbi:hypothetical protein [Chryseobacterium indologenes]|uniref:hypothetical protein n=2 Tax=Chryseobacterium indologenes TaxID=253 RepID=UPI000F4EB05A|nr:hypothetical protein [Chryseobacterium indologenes]MBF6646177.1 hypothetical protein [Chryseobacterium indologenes]MEB4762682.1 hypothetical protein [Chryseobacterium indologenes]